ncbi:glucokinase [Lysobacter sp. KIS68-7]|uniref:glucokinase n=1 Tax=Lysobacter sp. KIS68-7 TaxID=2904252 RepID=UPI001E65691A|nr:glucokinase [Lysobacter sp. KIS68-7]UHQ19323.1 glucokinase [Lysobacter sp. KIS68-7]
MSDDVALVADIGGTNARFALTDLSAATPTLREAKSLPAAEFASLQHAIEHYLGEVGVQPRRGALAVASPADRDEIRLTNRAWSFSRSELQRMLGFDELRVINDFGAVAWAVPALTPEDRTTLHGPTAGPLRGPVTVMGPGTGLGVAMLVGNEAHWHVVETEGGHVSFAPLGDEEQAIARWLTSQFGRCSNERVLCGAGLSHVDAVLRGKTHDLDARPVLRDPADIVAAALEGHDVAARRALARFCAVLGSVAGDAALIHGSRTVVIAGGMVPRFIPFLRSSAFRERFLAKGRFVAYLEGVTIHVITHPQPGLLGAAMSLRAGTKEGT